MRVWVLDGGTFVLVWGALERAKPAAGSYVAQLLRERFLNAVKRLSKHILGPPAGGADSQP